MSRKVMSCKAYGKINIGLDVIRRREDGYHELSMVMQTVSLFDEITLETTKKPGQIELYVESNLVPADNTNLAYRAAELLMKECFISQGLLIRLKKNIPIAAGMAGGSADAAAVLKGVNQLFELGFSLEELQERGVRLGADVPYCLLGGTALAEGIGEKLTILPSPPECFLVLGKPDISVSTKYVYENLHANTLTSHPDIKGVVEGIYQGDLKKIGTIMENVLERVTINRYPVIREIKELLLKEGAVGALMSGSGPTVFGMFETKELAEQALETLDKSGLARETHLAVMCSPGED